MFQELRLSVVMTRFQFGSPCVEFVLQFLAKILRINLRRKHNVNAFVIDGDLGFRCGRRRQITRVCFALCFGLRLGALNANDWSQRAFSTL